MMRVATTILTPEEMGRVALVLATTAFFAFFLISPVGMFINRRLHAWKASGVARYYLIRYVSYLLLVALTAAAGLSVLYLNDVMNFGMSVYWMIALVCGSLIFSTINLTAVPSLNLLGDSWRFMLLSVAMIASSLVCSVSLVLLVEKSAQYWLFGQILGQTLIGVIGVKFLFSNLQQSKSVRAPPSIHSRHLHSLFHFAWPVAIAAGLGWVQSQGYRFVIEGQLGLAQLGMFVAGYGISAGMISGFESVLTTYFQPKLYRDASGNDPIMQSQAWQNYAAAVIPSLMLTVILIVALAPELTRIFLGEHFQKAADYVLWGAFAEAARVLVGVYSLIAHVNMRTRWLILPNLVGAVISIILCVLMIPNFGMAGVGIGLVISGVSVVVTMHVFLARHVGGGIPVRSLLIAVLFSAVLWMGALSFRAVFSSSAGWCSVIEVLFPVSITYVALQFNFLRPHL
jgi:O-antigen/teichoic acid export membrane protein